MLRRQARSDPTGRRTAAGSRGSPPPRPEPAITPTVSRSPLGKTQAYEPGMAPQSSSSRPRHRSCSAGGTGISNSRPRSTCRYRTPTCRRGHPRRAVRPDHGTSRDRRTVGQPQAYPLGVLLDRADRDPLPQLRAGGDRRRAQPVVELLAAHHRHHRTAVAAGELPTAVAGECHPVHPVVRGHLDPILNGRQRGADQATAAGLVPRVRGPLDDKCGNARTGSGVGRGQPRGASADDDEIPNDHGSSLGHRRRPDRRTRPPSRPPDRVRIFGHRGGNRRTATATAVADEQRRNHAAGATVGGRATGVPGGHRP